MRIEEISDLSPGVKNSLLNLWNSEYQDHLAHKTFHGLETYLSGLSKVRHFLLFNGEIISGWAWTFDREDDRWFAIIISEEIQGKGFGKLLMDRLKQEESVLNGWVTDHNEDARSDGKPYLSPLGFYVKNGFVVLEDERFEKGKLRAVKIRWERGNLKF